MADQIIGKVVKGIAGGVGLVSEGISHHKQQKAARKSMAQDHSSSQDTEHPDEQMQIQENDETVFFHADDEVQWNLDDAQEEQASLNETNTSPAKTERDVHKITANFISRYPPPQYPSLAEIPRLPLPVLVPQRRPKDRARGFIRAYAPVLEEVGINQDMFLDFLETFNQASQASPWINAINLAGFATMALPMGIGIAVQAAITIAVKTATEIHSRHRTATFLDTVNDEFFRPRGLFCLVMTWNPESDATETSVNLTTTISTAIDEHDTSPTGMSKLKHNLQRSSGNTYGEVDFPETAPLIFPGLDKLQEHTSEEAKSKREKLKRTKKFVSEYYDRRAQAEYAGQNLNSALSKSPKPSFSSRFADPNHASNSGNLLSLVTGGRINLPSLPELIRAGRGGGYDYRSNTAYDRFGGFNRGFPVGRNSQQGGSSPFPGGGLQAVAALNPILGVKKLLTSKVLYLLIVNLPSEDEVAAANHVLSEFQQASQAQHAH
ncbi:hypothetical protein F5884DRAFT_382191 [Xylogone sp. PMI_703]|nr:hypothetical protein F5884DRAFT_382191 [Xylogone sp. PMI_703]